jgi:hypothetical protein
MDFVTYAFKKFHYFEKDNMDGQIVTADNGHGHLRFFEFYSDEAMVFKCLSKHLHKNYIDATFMITEHGIFLQENTDKGLVMTECMFKIEKFLYRKIPEFEEKGSIISLGFSTKDLKDALDRIAKTDHIRFYVLVSNYNVLHFEITSPSKGTNIYKFITLKKTSISNITSPNYTDHQPTAVIQGSHFKKATTDAYKNSKTTVRIRAQEFGVLMEGTGSAMRGFSEIFGQWRPGMPEIYNEMLSTPKIHSFSDIAPVAKRVQIYACADDRPLKIMADLGGIGSISFYLQPDVTQKKEQPTIEQQYLALPAPQNGQQYLTYMPTQPQHQISNQQMSPQQNHQQYQPQQYQQPNQQQQYQQMPVQAPPAQQYNQQYTTQQYIMQQVQNNPQ